MTKKYDCPAVEEVLFNCEENFLASNGIKGDYKNMDQLFFGDMEEDDEFA